MFLRPSSGSEVPGLHMCMKPVYSRSHHAAKNHKTGNDRSRFFGWLRVTLYSLLYKKNSTEEQLLFFIS